MKRFIVPALTLITVSLLAAGQAAASDRGCGKSYSRSYSHGHSHGYSRSYGHGHSHGYSHYNPGYSRGYCAPPVYVRPACPPPVHYHRPPCGPTRTFGFSSPGFGIFFSR